MKTTHKLFITTFVFLLIICACTKKKNDTSLPTDSYNESTQNSQNNLTIDIKELETLVKQAKTLTAEVVIAITILHHNELKDLENKMFDHNINAYEKEKLFESRKNDFFNKLQFSYDDYTSYIAENSVEINNYISSHPQIMDYLRTENRGEK